MRCPTAMHSLPILTVKTSQQRFKSELYRLAHNVKGRPGSYLLSLCCWQGAPDDGVDLPVNIQLGHAPAGRVVGKAHRDGLGALRQRHRDLKQLQREKKKNSFTDPTKTHRKYLSRM